MDTQDKQIRATVYDHSNAILVKPRKFKKKKRSVFYEFKQNFQKTNGKPVQKQNTYKSRTNSLEEHEKPRKCVQLFVHVPPRFIPKVLCLDNVKLHNPVLEVAERVAKLLKIDNKLFSLYSTKQFKLEQLLSFHDHGIVADGNIFLKMKEEHIKGGADQSEKNDGGSFDSDTEKNTNITQALKDRECDSMSALTDDEIRSLASKIGNNWYGLGLELAMDETVLDNIAERSLPPAKQCSLMLQKWKESCSTKTNQMQKILRALERIEGGDKAVQFLRSRLKEVFQSSSAVDSPEQLQPRAEGVRNLSLSVQGTTSTSVTVAEETLMSLGNLAVGDPKKPIVHQDYLVQDTSEISSMTTGSGDTIHVSDNASVGNIATNVTAHNLIQGTIRVPTDEEKSRNLNQELELNRPMMTYVRAS